MDIPNTAGTGLRQQRAAQLRAELETRRQQQKTATEAPLGDADATAAVDTAQEASSTTDVSTLANGPRGTGAYVVKDGDSIASIGDGVGHLAATVWNHSANSELCAARENPNVLLPGDRVTVPPTTEKQEPGATEERHRFYLNRDRLRLRVALRGIDDQPMAHASYRLEFGQRHAEGTTDAQGLLDHEIPIQTKEAKLALDDRTLVLKIAYLDPISEPTGWQARLCNLGYAIEEGEPPDSQHCRSAVEEFQCDYGLVVDGRVGPATTAKLKEVYGC